MSARPLPIFIDAQDFHGNPRAWTEISRVEAHRFESQGLLVVVLGAHGAVTRFDERSPFWLATGPYNYSSLRYFVSFPAPSPGATTRPAASSRKSVPTPVEPEPELVPLEEPEPEAKPAQRAAAPPAAKSKEPDKKELRFDLALDPATPGLEDDVFILSSGDGTYNISKTVRDDKVPGDKKLTLVFPGVEEGKTYTLSQVQDGEETVLVPEVTYAPAKAAAGPGEVVGCKAVFRECRIKGEKEDFYREKEGDYLIELVPATSKWVYVFGGPQGKPYRLIAEAVGLSDGTFRPVDVVGQAGKAQREPLMKSCPWMTLPLLVNGKAWDLYACLSSFQLSWKRIEQLAAKPQARCYKVGAREGGILWAPGHVGRDVPDLLNARDPRVKDPGKDALLMGLLDPMAEAKRRADIYQKRVVPYLESRFDLPPEGGKPVPAAERRRKYVAGLLKVLVEQHPDKVNLRAALAGRGLALDSYLIEQNEKEIALRKKAEKSGAALVKWMDHPSGLFESALCDYTADPSIPDLWEEAKEDFAYLIRYFDVTSLTRLYSRKIVERKEAWVFRFILSEEAHQAARKLNNSTVEILSWLGKVLVRQKGFSLKVLEEYYGRFVSGLKFKYRAISSLEEKSLVAEYFPDERRPRPQGQRVKFWEALEGPGFRREVRILWLDESCKPLEKLGKVADNKVAKSLLLGLEGVNVLLAVVNDKPDELEDAVAILGGSLDMFLVIAESVKIAGKKAGRGILSILGGVSAAIDFYFAVAQAREDADRADYDAMAAQIAIAAGSATLAVGSATVATTIYSGLTAGGLSLEAIFTIGGGISATGAGAPVGAILILAGVALVAAGSVAYLLAKDSELEAWIKMSPFGIAPGWSFSDENSARPKIWKLSQRLFPWKISGTHAFLNGQSDYVITIQGPLNPYSKIKVEALDFMDKEGRRTRFLQDETLRPVDSKNLRILTSLGVQASISIFLKDSACWAAHKQRHPSAENGFVFCGLKMEIDQHGDGSILWRPWTRENTLVFNV